MLQVMSGYSGSTKLGLAKAADKLANHFAEMSPEELAERTGAVKDTAVIGRETHSWNKTSDSKALVNITIQPGQHQSSPVIDLSDL
jgi:hypothetical protein